MIVNLKQYVMLLVSIFLINIANANDYLDKSYEYTETFIYDTSNDLDTSFSGEDYNIDNRNLAKADIYYESVDEKGQAIINNSNIKIRLLFPRFRDKYRVSLENYNKNNSIDDRDNSESFLFGLTHNKARIGVKFRGIEIDPFVSYNLKTTQYFENELELYLGNRAIYFSDFGFDNTVSVNFSKDISENSKISFDNSYRFQEEYDNKYELLHSVNLYVQLNSRKSLHYTVSSYATKDDIINKNLEVDYYYAGATYKNYFYKNWGYYEFGAGLTFRDENNFDAKGRALFRIGALFGNAKPKLNN